MAIRVTERPPEAVDETRGNDGAFSYRSSRTLDVWKDAGGPPGPISYTDALAALIAYGADKGIGVDYGQAFDSDFSDAVVVGRAPVYNAVGGTWTFGIRFGDGAGSGWLTQPPKMRYQPYTYGINVDFDQSATPVPYQNTAGTPFEPAMPRDLTGVVITIRVPKADYEFGDLFLLNNCINSEVVLLPDGNSIPIGVAKLVMPDMTFKDVSAENIYLDIKLDCRGLPFGWNHHVIDQGAEGWYEDPTDGDRKVRGLFTTGAAGQGPAGQVLLDGTGKPIRDEFMVADIGGNVYPAVSAPTGLTTSGAVKSPPVADGGLTTYDPDTKTGIVVLAFKQFRSANLNTIFA